MRPAVALIGIGNPYRRDDGIGPAVVTAIGNRHLPGLTVTVTDADPSRLIDAWSGADLAVIIDAVRCDPSIPGRIHRTAVSAPGPGPAAASTHGLGVPDIVRLAEALDRAPRRLVVLAVEASDLGFGPGLSPVVAEAVPLLVRNVLGELQAAHHPHPRTPRASQHCPSALRR
ncbi:hydrogenase maturation protease [Pseudonocardia acidicola]|uniref:Hydrogenase maturation protease n=1 Tax=Pseudonocardia acidicola TaxID=2724939 RepID=A0ABX1SBI2_9PSEU|nr:hydrogenase maturation protease [Pseudonocardia acidicola]NMH97609.1 hydrogenase maturation protease [Pseudonocardia acidicola]